MQRSEFKISVKCHQTVSHMCSFIFKCSLMLRKCRSNFTNFNLKIRNFSRHYGKDQNLLDFQTFRDENNLIFQQVVLEKLRESWKMLEFRKTFLTWSQNKHSRAPPPPGAGRSVSVCGRRSDGNRCPRRCRSRSNPSLEARRWKKPLKPKHAPWLSRTLDPRQLWR